MYRIIFIIVVALAVFIGLLVGTLNAEPVSIDLLWFQLTWPLGLLVLTSVALGALAAWLLCWFFSVLPLRVQLRKLRGKHPAAASGSLTKPDA